MIICFLDLPVVHGVVNHFPKAAQSIVLEVASVLVAGFPRVNPAPVLVVVLKFTLIFQNMESMKIYKSCHTKKILKMNNSKTNAVTFHAQVHSICYWLLFHKHISLIFSFALHYLILRAIREIEHPFAVNAVVLEVALKPRSGLPDINTAAALFVLFELACKNVARSSVPKRMKANQKMIKKKSDEEKPNKNKNNLLQLQMSIP